MPLKGTRLGSHLLPHRTASSTLILGAPLPQASPPRPVVPAACGPGKPAGQNYGVPLDQIFPNFQYPGYVSYSIIFKILNPGQINDARPTRIAKDLYRKMIDVHQAWCALEPRFVEKPSVMVTMDMGGG